MSEYQIITEPEAFPIQPHDIPETWAEQQERYNAVFGSAALGLAAWELMRFYKSGWVCRPPTWRSFESSKFFEYTGMRATVQDLADLIEAGYVVKDDGGLCRVTRDFVINCFRAAGRSES